MKYIMGGRGVGKTTEIVKEVIDNDGILVTFSYREAKRIESIYPELKNRVYSYESTSGIWASQGRKVYVDNADYILRVLLKREIETVSFNIGDINQLG